MAPVVTPVSNRWAQLRNIGDGINRFGVVLLLLWIGLFKFTPTEAEGIRPLLESSPFMSWMLPVMGVQGASLFIGGFEIVAALLLVIALRYPYLDRYAGAMVVLMSLLTLSFLLTTPGMFATIDGLYVPTGGAFVLKDLLLLGSGFGFVARGTQA